MKKLLVFLAFGFLTFQASAVGVSDIPAIYSGAIVLTQDTQNLLVFAEKLKEFSNNSFQISLINSTQTVTINAAMRQGLLAQYHDLLIKIQTDLDVMPR